MLSRLRVARKTLYTTLAVFVWACLHTQSVHSDIITTDTLLQEVHADNLKQNLEDALDRQDVLSMLQNHGVSPEQAEARVAAMTDEEAAQLAAHFDDLPAGGNVTLLLVVIILILLLR